MATDSDLKPEAESEQPLDQAGAKSLSSGETAELDQIEAGLNDTSPADDQAAAGSGPGAARELDAGHEAGFSLSPQKIKKGFLGSKRRKVFAIGAGLGLAGGIGVFLFFLLLFKNLQIRNLFLDYEFARFNRGFRNRMERTVEEANDKATGTPDSTVDPGATPEANIDNLDASEIKQLNQNPDALTDAEGNAIELDQSDAGTGGQVNTDFNVDETLPDVAGKSDADIADTTTTDIKTEATGDSPAGDPPIQAVQDAADDTQAAIDKGAVGLSALENPAVQGFARGLNNVVSKLSGPFTILTFLCIGRDILATPGHLIQKYLLGAAVRQSSFALKTADCATQGDPSGGCPLSQQGAVAAKFDAGSGPNDAGTDSCAWRNANNLPVIPGTNCTPLDDNLQPTTHPGGTLGKIETATAALDGSFTIPIIHTHINAFADFCKGALNPVTQITFAAVNVSSAALAAATGNLEITAGDVAASAGTTAAVIFGSKAAKALAVDSALYYGKLLFKQNFTGAMFTNIMDMGTKARATDTCIKNGCRQLSQSENTALALAIDHDQEQLAQSKGLAYRLFAADNPHSVVGRLAMLTPSSPGAALADLRQFAATLFNPGKLALGAINLVGGNAQAATVPYQTYGIPDYGLTDAELNQWGVVENSQWVANNMNQSEKDHYDACFNAQLSDVIADNDPNNPMAGPLGYCNDPHDVMLEHYRIYKLDQRVTYDLGLLYNNQPGTQAGATQAADTNTPVNGTAASLAQQLLNNKNFSGSGREVTHDLQLTAQGQPGTAGAPLSVAILKLLVTLTQSHSVDVSALESGGSGHCNGQSQTTCPGDPHYNGDGVDIDRVDGVQVTGRNAPAITIMNAAFAVLPSGSRFGQSQCGPDPALPAGFSDFTDSCNHLHVDVPKGTP